MFARTALMIEPQYNLTWRQILDITLTAQSSGFEALLRSDHYTAFDGVPRNATDAWATLAGLAIATDRIRLGTLVSPATFRSPGELAKVVTTVDEMSGGRVELGLGTGWYGPEHLKHALPFPEASDRRLMLEETLEIITRLWGPDGASFEGKFWTLHDSQFHPKSVQKPRPWLIVGGNGGPKSAALAARFADEYNVYDVSPDDASHVMDTLAKACSDIGRDPKTLHLSVMAVTIVGKDLAQLHRRARAVDAIIPQTGGFKAILSKGSSTWLVGTPSAVRERAAEYAAKGVWRLVFQDLLAEDLDMVRLIAHIDPEQIARG